MVRRLVEEQDVRLAPRELGEGETRLLPAGEELDRRERVLARQAEAAKVLARLLDRHTVGGEASHVVHRCLLDVHHLEVVLPARVAAR